MLLFSILVLMLNEGWLAGRRRRRFRCGVELSSVDVDGWVEGVGGTRSEKKNLFYLGKRLLMFLLFSSA